MALILDVGMNNGDDTAFYLHRGHSVVAIEAAPKLAKAAASRFHSEVDDGRLIILNVAAAQCSGEVDLFICPSASEWNSLHRCIAGRAGERIYSVRVSAVRFADILAKYGRPYYIKIDVEGSDAECLAQLNDSNMPVFISAESECVGDTQALSEAEYLAIIRIMYARGFNRFKLVNQHTLVPVCRSVMDRVFVSSYRQEMREGLEQENKWHFRAGSSGPFADDIPGPWMEFSEAVDVYSTCRERFFKEFPLAPAHSFWFDWHATKL